jgi:hypothetical protein
VKVREVLSVVRVPAKPIGAVDCNNLNHRHAVPEAE